MFAKTIVLSDAFLDMPMGSRCLYMTLGMVADDDGFVNAPKSIMRQCGATEDDIKILIAKKFIIPFDSGVIVIKHWRLNNYLQKDRIQPTKYQEELATLSVDENGAYTQSCIHSPVYIDKDSIGKNSIGKINTLEAKPNRFTPPSVEEVTQYRNERHSDIDPEEFVDFYTSKGWMVGKNKMKDWKAAFRHWEVRRKAESSGKEKDPFQKLIEEGLLDE